MAARIRSRGPAEIWPGFVDALAALLVVIIFLLVVFVLAQVFLTRALTEGDEALQRLTAEVNRLGEQLSLARDRNAGLELDIAQLSASEQEANKKRDDTVLLLGEISSENAALSEQVDVLLARAESAESKLLIAQTAVTSDRDSIRTQLGQIESLRRDMEALRQLRSDLERQIASLAASLEDSEQTIAVAQTETQSLRSERNAAELESAGLRQRLAELEATLEEESSTVGALRDRSTELEARLATAEERTLLAQKEIEARDIRLVELQALYLSRDSALEEERSTTARANDRLQTLNRQVAVLRQQLLALQQALGAAETRDEEQQVVISDLGERLNRALAAKVEELSRYRSEFFGRLRDVLGDRQDIRIVGDRFVFQSEVLFTSGSAELENQGKVRLAELADTLLDISPDIPPDIPWILRVDGHTDAVPIHNEQFPSNWELSSARAISVITFLVERGIPSQRLAAAGFGQFQPLDPGNDEVAFRRNRRIELKLTER